MGQDADLRACQRIVEGSQYATIYKPIEKLAEPAIEVTLKLGKRSQFILNILYIMVKIMFLIMC